MNYTESQAELNTKTYNRETIASKAENIYEAITIMGKRAEQIAVEIKKELSQKLDDFASHTDSLDEVFENREQIEISKFYERMPKPQAIAIEEWLDDDVYWRKVDEEESK